jgi:uncharacterized membrane protein AbrB (regulator of aidB expression)
MEYSLSVPIVPVIVSAVVGVILGIVIGLSIAFMLATKLCSCSCSKMDGNLLHMIKGQRQKVNSEVVVKESDGGDAIIQV